MDHFRDQAVKPAVVRKNIPHTEEEVSCYDYSRHFCYLLCF